MPQSLELVRYDLEIYLVMVKLSNTDKDILGRSPGAKTAKCEQFAVSIQTKHIFQI